ncbi:hypothetical protein SMACR_12798 [Sordaria macrospora]|nr:hypothetical protein SMACR_12798 [Sordaria macrospora]WPJ57622.1 hypothetical protein SMAC4_13028 [Sordaria macrospora]
MGGFLQRLHASFLVLCISLGVTGFISVFMGGHRSHVSSV